MGSICDYRIRGDGTLGVTLADGRERGATPSEWLALWKSDPRITLGVALIQAAAQPSPAASTKKRSMAAMVSVLS